MFIVSGKQKAEIFTISDNGNRSILLQARFNERITDDAVVIDFLQEMHDSSDEMTFKTFLHECMIERKNALAGGTQIEFKPKEELLKSEVVDMVRSLNARNKAIDAKINTLLDLIETAEEVVSAANETVQLIESGQISGSTQTNFLKQVADKFTNARKEADEVVSSAKYAGEAKFSDEDSDDDEWFN